MTDQTPPSQSVVVPVSAIVGFDVEEYVGGYEFRGDEGGYMPTEKERELITDAIHGVMSELSCLSAPAPSSLAGGEVTTVPSSVIAACKGEEVRFEAWARSRHCDMTKHPLHYIFSDPKTEAARMGWNAALAYVRDAALSPEAPAREGVDWQPIETALQDGTKIDLWGYWPEHDRWVRTPDAVWDAERCDWKVNGFYAGAYVHPPRFTHWRAITGPEALTPRHEGPAEGAGSFAGSLAVALEDLSNAAEVVRRMLHNSKDHQSRAFDEAGIPFVTAINRAKLVLKDYDRARSSAQAREGVACSNGHQPGCDCDVAEEDVARSKPHPAAPSADKLREVVDALEASLEYAPPLSLAPKIRQALAALKAEGA